MTREWFILTQQSPVTRFVTLCCVSFNVNFFHLELLKSFLIPDYFNDMKEKFGYQKCESEDLNPFNKCTPIDCELKYFGKRNYFQHPHCVPVKVCENDPNVVYDYETNSCRNLKEIFSKDELKMLKAGVFKNFIEGTNEIGDNLRIDDRKNLLKRVRRSLNQSQTFVDMILSSMLFFIKIVSL